MREVETSTGGYDLQYSADCDFRLSEVFIVNAKLTAKQEAFLSGLLSGMTQVDAYRAAYDVSGMSDNAQHVEASKLCQNLKISLRIAEAAQASREKMETSTTRLTEMTLEAYKVAEDRGNAAHMTGAVLAMAG